jgi:hypothetical protein
MTSGYRVIGYRVIGVTVTLAAAGVLAIAGVAGCSLKQSEEPGLIGPSMTGLSLSLAASPDLLQRDGRTTSLVTITAFDAASRPVPNLGLHLDMGLDSATGALGALSQKDVTTGADGRASVIYTSPLPAPLGQSDEATVQIVATSVGNNNANAISSSLSIRLTAANQAGGPTASFTLGPKFPKIGDTILFDASASQPSVGSSIVTYAWDFGDGNAFVRVPYLTSAGPTITHEYSKSGTFTVGLTILDSNGKRSTTTYTLVVAS